MGRFIIGILEQGQVLKMSKRANGPTNTEKAAGSTAPAVRSQNGSQNISGERETLLQIFTEILGQLEDNGQAFDIVWIAEKAGTGIFLEGVELAENGTLRPVAS